jgi:hypothetical protein
MIHGIGNTIGTLAGMFVNLLLLSCSNYLGLISGSFVGFVLHHFELEGGKEGLLRGWDVVFILTLAIILVGTIVFILFGSAENEIDSEENMVCYH